MLTLQMIEGGLLWVDLGSGPGIRQEYGTDHSGWLSHSHGIGIGPYLIHLASEGVLTADLSRSDGLNPEPFASRAQDSDNLPRVVLEFRRDEAKPIRWRMRHILTLVGSSAQCKVRLSAPGMSRFHYSLLRTAAVWAINLRGGDPDADTTNMNQILGRLSLRTDMS